MKVQFSKETTYVPEFNKNRELSVEEQLSVKIKVMSLLDLLDLTDVLKSAGFEKGELKDMSVEQMKTIVKEGGKYIGKYCTLAGNDGFDISDVTGYAAFMPLATELLFTLLNTSSPSPADVKNS